jgi:hypothetical protein
MNLETRDYIIIAIVVVLIFILLKEWIWCTNDLVENLDVEYKNYQAQIAQYKNQLRMIEQVYSEPYDNMIQNAIDSLQSMIADLEEKIAAEKGESVEGIPITSEPVEIDETVETPVDPMPVDETVETPVDEPALEIDPLDPMSIQVNITDRELNELVEATVKKMLSELMKRTDKLDWNVAAKKIGDSMENMIRQYARAYGGMNKKQFAVLVGRQAKKMTNELLRDIERLEGDIEEAASSRRRFFIFENKGLYCPGGLIGNDPANSIEEAAKQCDDDDNCAAFFWNKGQNKRSYRCACNHYSMDDVKTMQQGTPPFEIVSGFKKNKVSPSTFACPTDVTASAPTTV